MIHPTAIIHPQAQLHSTVRIGPYSVIDSDVSIGKNCILGPYVYLTGATSIGEENRFHAGCVIGDAPQDLKYTGALTKTTVGNNNVFREHVTVHRSNKPEEDTVVGSNNFLMAHSHVGHNTHIGNYVVMANAALLAGHVVVEDRAFISATCMVHQFVRIGTLAFMQGGSGVSKDLPPFTIAVGNNSICGLNTVGLRRAGFTSEQRLELRKLYRVLFRNNELLPAAIAEARKMDFSDAALVLLNFVAASKRGVCTDPGFRAEPEEAQD